MDQLDEKFGHSEVATNAHGGRQSKLDARYDLISPVAIQRLAHVLWYGSQRYLPWNWRKIETADHLNHMIFHAYKYLEGDASEDHMGHLLARAMMAVDMSITTLNKDEE